MFQGSSPMVALPLAVLASANFILMIFNLLPAYPLDGGRTLDALLGAMLGRSGRCASSPRSAWWWPSASLYYALPTDFFMLLIALLPGASQLGSPAEHRRLAAVALIVTRNSPRANIRDPGRSTVAREALGPGSAALRPG